MSGNSSLRHETFLIAEPQCRGFEHARVNAHLVRGIREVLPPGTDVQILAEQGHLDEMAAYLPAEQTGMHCQSIRIPPRRSRGYSRLIRECLLVRAIARRAQHFGDVTRVLFLSGTPQTVIALRIFARALRRRGTIVILHSVVETLVSHRRSKAFWEAPLGLRPAVGAQKIPGLTFAVYSERVHRAVASLAMPAFSGLLWTDIPCFSYERLPSGSSPSFSYPLRIGVIGVGHRAKGTDLLFRLSTLLCDVRNIRLILVGFMKDRVFAQEEPGHIEILSRGVPLSAVEMREAIESLHYALFLFPPGEYILTETASFGDAVAANRPVIALRSPLMEEKFRLYGEIGRMADSVDGIAALIAHDAIHGLHAGYTREQANLRRAAEMLSPRNCGLRLLRSAGIIEREGA